MSRGVRWYLVGSVALVALTGCKPTWFEERESWRREAEMACLKAGAVKETPSVALLSPISGPGACGADFPLKVSGLGEDAPMSYADEPLRPPGDVPQASYPAQPSYRSAPPYQPPPTYQPSPTYQSAPIYQPPAQYPSNSPFSVNPDYPHDTRLPPRQDNRAVPSYRQPQYPSGPQYGAPPQPYEPPPESVPQQYEPPPPYPGANRYPSRAPARAPSNGPISLTPPGVAQPAGDAEGEIQAPLPRYGGPRTAPVRGYPSPANADEAPYRPPPRPAPFPQRYPGSSQVVPMSPSRMASLTTTASVSPPATLACPIVSTLDRWISEAVQPAAQKWFGQPVTGIKQISAYSCRGMNGDPNAHISEHAFGNALDIAAFTLADGRVVTVERGWHGAPEEQGFLRDVQGAACQLFNTVLAPGSNVYHYNHIHVDLMRRASGRRICEPGPMSGDEAAARVRARYAGRDPGITGSIPSSRGAARRHAVSAYDDDDRRLPEAVPGED